MVVWVSGLIFFGVLTETGQIPCNSVSPWQSLRSRRDAFYGPFDPSAPLLIVDEDEELSVPEEGCGQFPVSSALGGFGRPRVQERAHAPLCSVNLVQPPSLAIPAAHPRLVGVPLIYAFCLLLI